LYQRILAGDDFAKLAAEFSEDRASATKNGELPWFGTGRMVPEFETAAFEIKNIGDFGHPVQSAYGWHIIKLLDRKGLGSFESVKADIERKVKRDERANFGQKTFVAKLRDEYKYTENSENAKEIAKLLEGKTLVDSVFQAEASQLNKTLFTFADKSYSQADFVSYVKNNGYTEQAIASEIVNEKLSQFVTKELLAYEDTQLEKKYDDFRFLMNEYHDGRWYFIVRSKQQ